MEAFKYLFGKKKLIFRIKTPETIDSSIDLSNTFCYLCFKSRSWELNILLYSELFLLMKSFVEVFESIDDEKFSDEIKSLTIKYPTKVKGVNDINKTTVSTAFKF